MEIILGTANFGNNYGLLHRESILKKDEIFTILRSCAKVNVKRIDTAVTYGNSQKILGDYNAGEYFKITTKIPAEVRDLASLKRTLDDTFASLKVSSIDTLLFHSVETVRYSSFNEMIDYLELQVSKQRIHKIGVSVYSESEILECLEKYSSFHYFQINENILDQRKIHSKNLLNIASKGIDLGVRSIFLQGLLLSNENNIEKLPQEFRTTIIEFHKTLEELDMKPLDACLSYAKMIPWASSMTIGVRSADELIAISESFAKNDVLQIEKFAKAEEFIVDPRRWLGVVG